MRRLANKDRPFRFAQDRLRMPRLRAHLWAEHQRGVAYWPFKSARQRRLMYAVASGKPLRQRKSGMTQQVAKRFIRHSTGRKK